MRLWTLHPHYLDAQGLTALWREALLAQAVLNGKTRGYAHHPQLCRFQDQPDPRTAIASYLPAVHAESVVRGYRFDSSKIGPVDAGLRITVGRGQLAREWQHLLAKLQARSPAMFEKSRRIELPEPHPMFEIVPGPIATWERT